MPSFSIHSIIMRRTSRTDMSMPRRADRAWRRNWMTGTPAIASGSWKARNMPALPRTSVGQAVMSSPWNRIGPGGHHGRQDCPSSTLARVDLPDPLGPIRAWTWPDSTVRSTPGRIGRTLHRRLQVLDLEQGSGGACRDGRRLWSGVGTPAILAPFCDFPLRE